MAGGDATAAKIYRRQYTQPGGAGATRIRWTSHNRHRVLEAPGDALELDHVPLLAAAEGGGRLGRVALDEQLVHTQALDALAELGAGLVLFSDHAGEENGEQQIGLEGIVAVEPAHVVDHLEHVGRGLPGGAVVNGYEVIVEHPRSTPRAECLQLREILSVFGGVTLLAGARHIDAPGVEPALTELEQRAIAEGSQ